MWRVSCPHSCKNVPHIVIEIAYLSLWVISLCKVNWHSLLLIISKYIHRRKKVGWVLPTLICKISRRFNSTKEIFTIIMYENGSMVHGLHVIVDPLTHGSAAGWSLD